MSSTWSNLGINLQGTGDNSGTWGQLTNVNLQDFDYAISGVAAITLTGNTTLAFTTNSSSTTYSNEAGRAAVLVLSGSLSATTVTVTVPNIQKNYVIINNSGATATISAGGSTTVSLGTSTSAYVYSNGSSSIFTAITSNPGGTTNQVQYNNAGAFAGSTNLTFNGTTLAIQTATVLNLTSTTENITTANITTANVTTANVTSLTAVTATTTTENVGNINLISNGTLKIYNTANSQYTGLKIAAGATTTATFTLPSADGTSGQFLKTNGSGVLSFGAASAITWQSVQTTNFTASAGNGYPVNTTSAGITVTLPVSASTGDTIQIVDYAGTFATNNLTINSNGLNINGQTSNVVVSNRNEGLQLTYIDSTQGWKATLAANEGTNAAPQPYSVAFLVIAGGGAGAKGGGATGGGGAGGYRNSYSTEPSGGGGSTETSITLTPSVVYTITVGAGGASVTTAPTDGNSGSNSSIVGSGVSLTSTGGGGGGQGNGVSGGSGGGSGENGSTGGSGTTNQGFAGANYSSAAGGGGGGAGAVGVPVSTNSNGGAGLSSSITGSSVARGGGGGGSRNSSPSGVGGTGGGGNAGAGSGGSGTVSAGTANTGGGGGGNWSSSGNSGAGGSGVVILRMPTSKYSGTTTGSPTVTTSGSDTILVYNASGSYTA